jgi:hypothetical protein
MTSTWIAALRRMLLPCMQLLAGLPALAQQPRY